MRALLAQLSPVAGALEVNLARLETLLREHRDVQLAVFPELYLQGYMLERAGEVAISAQGEQIARVRAAAELFQTAVVVGFAERLAGGEIANSAACIDADGSLAGVHRKCQLFGRAERNAFAAGEDLHLLSIAGRRVAPLICFEVEFPEPARALARAGADLLVTIAANMEPYGAEHELAARSRALENRCPHLYVNTTGSYGALKFVGESCAIDSSGQRVALADEGEQLLEVEVPAGWQDAGGDLDYLTQVRSGLRVRVATTQLGERGGSR
jgi:predicted amidohydrolase